MEIDTREQDISMMDVSVLFWEGLWKYLEFSVLHGLLCGRLEAKSTEKDTDNWNMACELSEERLRVPQPLSWMFVLYFY